MLLIWQLDVAVQSEKGESTLQDFVRDTPSNFSVTNRDWESRMGRLERSGACLG